MRLGLLEKWNFEARARAGPSDPWQLTQGPPSVVSSLTYQRKRM
jgi:hypothetical protein